MKNFSPFECFFFSGHLHHIFTLKLNKWLECFIFLCVCVNKKHSLFVVAIIRYLLGNLVKFVDFWKLSITLEVCARTWCFHMMKMNGRLRWAISTPPILFFSHQNANRFKLSNWDFRCYKKTIFNILIAINK